MATQFVDRIAVETDGTGEPVLMIHGLGGTSNFWTPVLPALTRFRTIRPDLPGSGRSHRVSRNIADNLRLSCVGAGSEFGFPALFSGDSGAGFPPWAASGSLPRRESLLRRI